MSDPKVKASATSVSVISSIDLKNVRWRFTHSSSTSRIVLLIVFMTLTIVALVTLPVFVSWLSQTQFRRSTLELQGLERTKVRPAMIP